VSLDGCGLNARIANWPCPTIVSRNWATGAWNAPVPASSTRSDTWMGAVAAATLAIARSFPPSLTARSVAVRSVTIVPFASNGEKYPARAVSAARPACPIVGIASAITTAGNSRPFLMTEPPQASEFTYTVASNEEVGRHAQDQDAVHAQHRGR